MGLFKFEQSSYSTWEWWEDCIVLVVIVQGRFKINWSKKWDTSCLNEVRAVHGVVGGLHISSDWISLKTHQMTPPTILRGCPSIGFDPKSIGQRNWTLQVHTVDGVVGGLHSSCGWISLQTKWLHPPYYNVAHGLGSIWNQLVKEIGHFKFVRSSYRRWSGRSIA